MAPTSEQYDSIGECAFRPLNSPPRAGPHSTFRPRCIRKLSVMSVPQEMFVLIFHHYQDPE